MAAAETANIENKSFSKKVRRLFGLNLHSWEQLMLWSLGAVALAGIAVVWTTASVVVLQRAENARTKEEFERYKADAATELAGANANIAKANRATEEIRRQNLELEKALAPRALDQANSSAALRQFAGTQAVILFVSDFETRRLAGMIDLMLRMAGWNTRQIKLGDDIDAVDGIVVNHVRDLSFLRNFPSEDERADPQKLSQFSERNSEMIATAKARSDRRQAIAESLGEQLNASKLSAQVAFIPSMYVERRWPDGVSQDAIVIRVGLRPTAYFQERQIDEIRAKSPNSNIIMNNR